MLTCPSSSTVAPTSPQPTTSIGIAGIGIDAPWLPKIDRRAGVSGYDRTTTIADIKDGTANTMMLSESGRAIGSWLQGSPATVRGLDPINTPYIGPGRQFGGRHDNVAVIAMAGGSVRVVRESIAPKLFEAYRLVIGLGQSRQLGRWVRRSGGSEMAIPRSASSVPLASLNAAMEML
jgi:hypothetical protein